MADDLNILLDQFINDAFKPLPSRRMLGQTYENVPHDQFILNPEAIKNGMPLYTPQLEGQQDTQPGEFYHTYEPDAKSMSIWRLKKFLGS